MRFVSSGTEAVMSAVRVARGRMQPMRTGAPLTRRGRVRTLNN